MSAPIAEAQPEVPAPSADGRQTPEPAPPTADEQAKVGEKRSLADASENPAAPKNVDAKATPHARRTYQLQRLPNGSPAPSFPDTNLMAEVRRARMANNPSPSKSKRKKELKKLRELKRRTEGNGGTMQDGRDKDQADSEEEPMEEDEPLPQPSFGHAKSPATNDTQTPAPTPATTKGDTTLAEGDEDDDDEVQDELMDGVEQTDPQSPSPFYSPRPGPYVDDIDDLEDIMRTSDINLDDDDDIGTPEPEPAPEPEKLPAVDPDIRTDILVPERNFPTHQLVEGVVTAFLDKNGRDALLRDVTKYKVGLIHATDYPQACPIKRRGDIVAAAAASMKTNDLDIEEAHPQTSLGGQALGSVDGIPPTIFIADVTPHQKALALHDSQRVQNFKDKTVFAFDIPLPRTTFACGIDGVEHLEVSERNKAKITEAYRQKIPVHDGILRCLDMHHDGLNLRGDYTRAKGIAALQRSLNVDGAPPATRGVTGNQWTLRWTQCPSSTAEGEIKWITTMRQVSIEIKNTAKINPRASAIRICKSCHANDHTDGYCPFIAFDGWSKNPALPTASSTRGGRGGGRGGRGSAGRGGGRGGRGRGSGRRGD